MFLRPLSGYQTGKGLQILGGLTNAGRGCKIWVTLSGGNVEYSEMIERLHHVLARLDGETRKFSEGEVKRQFLKDLDAVEWAIKIVEENQ